MTEKVKIVRTDQELECPHVDQVLLEKGIKLVLLPDNLARISHHRS